MDEIVSEDCPLIKLVVGNLSILEKLMLKVITSAAITLHYVVYIIYESSTSRAI